MDDAGVSVHQAIFDGFDGRFRRCRRACDGNIHRRLDLAVAQEPHARYRAAAEQPRATQVFRDPGTGSVDFPGIAALLDEAGYRGPVTCSARQTRDPFRALLRIRALLSQIQN